MPDSWSLMKMVGVAVMVGIPVAALVTMVRRAARDATSARRLRLAADEREALRRPPPGSLTLEGQVGSTEATAKRTVITERRQHGCLGGPLVYDVPRFALRVDDGSVYTVDMGPDPLVEHTEYLRRARVGPGQGAPRNGGPSEIVTVVIPRPTGEPDLFELIGRVRLSGVISHGPGLVGPPPGRSAVLTVLAGDPPDLDRI